MTPRKKAGVTALVALVVATTAGVLAFDRLKRPEPQLPHQKYLAVLPFKDLSGRPDGQLFSQGFSEAVSSRLGKYSGIQVIPPASSSSLVAKNAGFKRIAQELGATLLLDASVQRNGDNLRISYHLVDSTSGADVGGDAVNGSVQNIWAAQDEVADSIARDLGIEQRRPPSKHAGLETAEEQDAYVRALGNLENSQNEKSVESAVDRLRDLRESAADSPLVAAALARAYLAKFIITHDKDWIDRAIKSSDRAQMLDPDSADVLVTVGKVRQLSGRHDEAIAAYKRALTLQPNFPEAAIGLGEAFSGAQKTSEAEMSFQRGIRLRPTWWSGHHYLGILYLTTGRYDDAAKEFAEVIRLNPENSWGYSNFGVVAVTKGSLREGATAFEKAISLGGGGVSAYGNLSYCYYFLGDYDKAAAAARKATELGPAVAGNWANLADSCAWSSTCRGEVNSTYDKAIELLRRDLTVNPDNARAHATLAVCLAKRGELGEAKTHIRRALELDPKNPTRMYQAARVSNAAHDSDETITWLQRAIKAGYQSFEVDRDPEFGSLRSTTAYRFAFKKSSQSA